MVKSISKLTVFYPGQATGGGASNGPKEEHHQMIFILLNQYWPSNFKSAGGN